MCAASHGVLHGGKRCCTLRLLFFFSEGFSTSMTINSVFSRSGFQVSVTRVFLTASDISISRLRLYFFLSLSSALLGKKNPAMTQTSTNMMVLRCVLRRTSGLLGSHIRRERSTLAPVQQEQATVTNHRRRVGVASRRRKQMAFVVARDASLGYFARSSAPVDPGMWEELEEKVMRTPRLTGLFVNVGMIKRSHPVFQHALLSALLVDPSRLTPHVPVGERDHTALKEELPPLAWQRSPHDVFPELRQVALDCTLARMQRSPKAVAEMAVALRSPFVDWEFVRRLVFQEPALVARYWACESAENLLAAELNEAERTLVVSSEEPLPVRRSSSLTPAGEPTAENASSGEVAASPHRRTNAANTVLHFARFAFAHRHTAPLPSRHRLTTHISFLRSIFSLRGAMVTGFELPFTPTLRYAMQSLYRAECRARRVVFKYFARSPEALSVADCFVSEKDHPRLHAEMAIRFVDALPALTRAETFTSHPFHWFLRDLRAKQKQLGGTLGSWREAQRAWRALSPTERARYCGDAPEQLKNVFPLTQVVSPPSRPHQPATSAPSHTTGKAKGKGGSATRGRPRKTIDRLLRQRVDGVHSMLLARTRGKRG